MWLTSLVLAAAIGGVYLQCLTTSDDFSAATFSTDLSGINDFGIELYKQLSPGNSSQNFFFSPYSIWSALTLAYFGSGGNTQRQLEASLRVSDKNSTFNLWKELEHLDEQREKNNTLNTFNLANRAYFQHTLTLNPCVQSILNNGLRVLNFTDTVSSANEINTFVSQTTKGRITKVITPRDLTDVVMVLVNAAFFKGTWKLQFKPSATTQKDFTINPEETTPLDMMSQKGSFNYGVSQQLGARILELPYFGNTLSMFILLPTINGVPESRFTNMVNNLNGATLRKAINPRYMYIHTVDVQLPKFKFQMKIEKELKKALKNMGIVDIFDSEVANMTFFQPSEELSLNKTIHEAFIEVNEEGAEAAAATNVVSIALSRGPKSIPFHCNEPFIFLIYDKQTKNVLFMGAFKNPRG